MKVIKALVIWNVYVMASVLTENVENFKTDWSES